jgi:hypothetical protein
MTLPAGTMLGCCCCLLLIGPLLDWHLPAAAIQGDGNGSNVQLLSNHNFTQLFNMLPYNMRAQAQQKGKSSKCAYVVHALCMIAIQPPLAQISQVYLQKCLFFVESPGVCISATIHKGNP